ncbi:MAG: MvaI/BcnI restriction endonuclease family protein [Proteobacteria bacterium]|nr:MvaI/BcnI restriction endonuclease family protein [Pseudomonadota bacterium]
MDLDKLRSMMLGNAARHLYFKPLSPNDNNKNQPYFGADFSSLNIIPTGDLVAARSTSRKDSVSNGDMIFKAPVFFSWMDVSGKLYSAPHAQLILYPQYPEVRFSGFLKGCEQKPSVLMDPNKRGRDAGRVLFMGVREDGHVIGYLASPESVVAKQSIGLRELPVHGLFHEIDIESKGPEGSTRNILLKELRRVHELEWITGKRLMPDRTPVECNSPNCGGYTLEAELGITPNGYSEPDFLGWEVKQYGVDTFENINAKVVTLMTPEPSGGWYQTEGVESFLRRFGYADRSGKADRINFGGVHKYGNSHKTTGLILTLSGFDPKKGKIKDASGGIVLETHSGEIAAIWHYSKLIDHWKRKHAQAVYVPSLSKANAVREYFYGKRVKLGLGTDFSRLLSAIYSGAVYYDPGIKMEDAASARPKIKRRSQFRVKSGNLGVLYAQLEEVDV